MELPIFFNDALVNSDIVTLDEDTSKHIAQVLRMNVKEQLHLTDGVGNLVTGEIIDNHKKGCVISITEKKWVPKKEQQVSVAISLLKNTNRFEWFLEKATEIGVTEIIPLLCDRTEKQHFRYSRMKQVLISAMMQSKQAWLPNFREPTKVSDIFTSSGYSTKLVAHCSEGEKKSITDYRKNWSVQILIGPEGDFTKQEISFCLENNFCPVTLGETRLRTETAGVVAATVLCL